MSTTTNEIQGRGMKQDTQSYYVVQLILGHFSYFTKILPMKWNNLVSKGVQENMQNPSGSANTDLLIYTFGFWSNIITDKKCS